jgi:hypothetical protein
MAVLEAPTEEECYLLAILEDKSGLDLAEFTWYSPDSEDGCFRAWPFQWTWWRCDDKQQIDQCARSVGKSLSIKVRSFAFPFNFPGQEEVITAPELIHLEPIVGLIENQFQDTRLGREMLKRGRSSINHRPFMMQFQNGARIIGRIPQRDGRGAKGIHPIRLEQDESQDYPEKGWTELNETLKRGFADAQWRAHGVTKGVQGSFYDKTQEGSGWTVHRITAMMRPNWTDEERQLAIEAYGSSEDPDYRRNILGMHGDATNTLFVLRKLMQCVDIDLTDDYNNEEYFHRFVRDTDLQNPDDPEEGGLELITKLNLQPIPQAYTTKGFQVWMGMDVGFTSDPSEILIAVEYHPSADELAEDKANLRGRPPKGTTRLRIIGRITLRRIPGPLQTEVILHLIDFYNPRAFSMDKSGNGLPLYQGILARARAAAGADQARYKKASEQVKGYNFSEKVLVEISDPEAAKARAEVQGTNKELTNEELADEAGIGRLVLEYSTDKLREYVDASRLMMPWDKDAKPTSLLAEFHGQTFSYSNSPQDPYGRRRRSVSEGRFHALDAARMLVMGMAQATIEEFIDTKPVQAPVIDRPVTM